jgi:hypothetical protein
MKNFANFESKRRTCWDWQMQRKKKSNAVARSDGQTSN